MVSSKKDGIDFKPLLVVLLCLAGASAGAYFLYDDFNHSAGEGLGPPMARIERREAKVRRKPSRSFAWNNAQQDEKLFRRDSVQTSAASAATIRFNDGTVLELGENSLVVIEDIQNLSLDFLKGAVVLHTAQGDKRVTVGSDGKAKFEEVPVRLLKPDPLARFFTQARESLGIHFAWEPRQGQESALTGNLMLQISPDRGFRGGRVRTFPLKDTHTLSSDLPLGEGAYFWRLAAGDKALTDVGQFRVIAASPLQPVSPAGGEKLLTYSEETVTLFKWLAPEELGGAGQVTHELQIARDAEFRTLVAHQEIVATGEGAAVRNLSEGGYHWRILSRYGDLQIKSRTERFLIAKARRPTLALNLPEDKKTFEHLPTQHFSWTTDAQGLDYQLEVRDAHGKDVTVGAPKTRSTSQLVKGPDPGIYRWRVTAHNKNESVGETAWRTFSVFEGARIALRAPAQSRELYYWEKPLEFDFEWDRDELLSRQPGYSYQVAIARDAEFRDQKLGPRLRENSMPSRKLTLEPGPYFWKVLVVDEKGQAVKSSEAWRFAYGVFPPLKAPEPVAPARLAVFNLVDQPADPVASWQEVKSAESYDVTLFAVDPAAAPGRSAASADAPPPGARVVFHTVTDKTSAEFKGLKPANYYWSVRAIDRLKRKGVPMPALPFSVTYGELLGAPKIISPEVQ